MAENQAGKTRNPAQVLADIEAGRLLPVYLLVGPDAATAEEILGALKVRIVAPGFEALVYDNLHAPGQNEAGSGDWVATTLQLVNTPPMGTARRLVVVRELTALGKLRARDFCAGLARTPEFATVAVTCEYDREYAAMFNSAGLGGSIVRLDQPGDADLVVLLRRWAREQGIELTGEAVTLLCSIAGVDTALLKGELGKIATAVGRNGRATADTVREVAANSREYTLNEYVGHALNRDRKRALAVLRRLLDWGEEPIRIIAWLVNGLLGCIGGRADGPWNPNELNRALNQLYDVNRLIVTGYPEPYLLLEAFTVCLACGERSRTCRLRLRSNPPGICLLRPRSQAVRRMAANG